MPPSGWEAMNLRWILTAWDADTDGRNHVIQEEMGSRAAWFISNWNRDSGRRGYPIPWLKPDWLIVQRQFLLTRKRRADYSSCTQASRVGFVRKVPARDDVVLQPCLICVRRLFVRSLTRHHFLAASHKERFDMASPHITTFSCRVWFRSNLSELRAG